MHEPSWDWGSGQGLTPEQLCDPQTLIFMVMPLQYFLIEAIQTGKEPTIGGSSQTSSWRYNPSAFHFFGASLRQTNGLFLCLSFLLWEMKREGDLDQWRMML